MSGKLSLKLKSKHQDVFNSLAEKVVSGEINSAQASSEFKSQTAAENGHFEAMELLSLIEEENLVLRARLSEALAALAERKDCCDACNVNFLDEEIEKFKLAPESDYWLCQSCHHQAKLDQQAQQYHEEDDE